MGQKRQGSLSDTTIFTFHYSILVVGMRTRVAKTYAKVGKYSFKWLVILSPIRLNFFFFFMVKFSTKFLNCKNMDGTSDLFLIGKIHMNREKLSSKIT